MALIQSPFIKGKKLSDYTEKEITQILHSIPEKDRRSGFFQNIGHIKYAQEELTGDWFEFHKDDELYYNIICNICGKDLGVGDYKDGHHPYHQEYNACKEHENDYSISIKDSSTSTSDSINNS